ncbi:WhiB family transcriptional regulator [Streptomyces sp. NPDC052236]|uniref:WhiB family transcriptional regulator n=1 Tax=Streptomyces sp. NPDC052236 TaxID=3365686 RepID=UPI0037D96AEE
MTTRLAPYPPLTGSEPCRQPDADPEWWFTAEDEAFARALCLACPVRVKCLAWALDNPEHTEHGIWAATDPDRRTELRSEFAADATTEQEKA